MTFEAACLAWRDSPPFSQFQTKQAEDAEKILVCSQGRSYELSLEGYDASGMGFLWTAMHEGSFAHLEDLSLKNLKLRNLPDCLINLTALKVLDISNNPITSLALVTRLRSLQGLICENCDHLTRLPDDIGNNPSLSVLKAAHCRLTHLPESLGNLTLISVANNCLKRLPSEAFPGRRFLAHNNPLEEIPASVEVALYTPLASLHDIRNVIRFYTTDRTALSPYTDPLARELTRMSFKAAKEYLAEAAPLLKGREEKSVDRRAHAIEDGLRTFRSRTGHLPFTWLKTTLAAWVGAPAAQDKLTAAHDMLACAQRRSLSLDFSLCSFRPPGLLTALKYNFFPHIKKLDLSEYGLEGELPEALGMLQHLEILNISDNNMTRISVIVALLALRSLLCPNNKIETLPERLGFMPQLTNLNVANNRITRLPHSLKNRNDMFIVAEGNPLFAIPSGLPKLKLTRERVWLEDLWTMGKTRLFSVPERSDPDGFVFNYEQEHARAAVLIVAGEKAGAWQTRLPALAAWRRARLG